MNTHVFRRAASLTAIAGMVALAACADAPTVARNGDASRLGHEIIAGHPGAGPSSASDQETREPSGEGKVAQCERRPMAVGSAVITPSGGVLAVGRNYLVVPPGALTRPTLITATVVEGTNAAIHFEPAGLQFRKPAGLVLDAEGCALPDAAPEILYIEHGVIVERIRAIYSNHWHTVAAPIWHFSVYAIGV